MSLIGVILSLAILGGLAAFVVSQVGGSSGINPDHLPALTLPQPAPTPTPAGPTGIINAAAAVTCRSDYQTVLQAASEYQVLHGGPPANLAALGPSLKDAAVSPYFTITIDARHPGQVDVATAGHPAAAGDGNCSYAG